jgi:hypothetical protein
MLPSRARARVMPAARPTETLRGARTALQRALLLRDLRAQRAADALARQRRRQVHETLRDLAQRGQRLRRGRDALRRLQPQVLEVPDLRAGSAVSRTLHASRHLAGRAHLQPQRLGRPGSAQ